MKHYFILLLLFSVIVSMTSCDPSNSGPPDSVSGYAPIYLQKVGSDTIRFLPSEPTVKGGKIYIKDDILYQVELYKGIHIIDISDPEHAQKIGFYQIFGCTQVTMQDTYMYVNSSNDFLVIDISNMMDPKVVDYKINYFKSIAFPPPPAVGYFECIDPSKGIVIEWKKVTLQSPKCRF